MKTRKEDSEAIQFVGMDDRIRFKLKNKIIWFSSNFLKYSLR